MRPSIDEPCPLVFKRQTANELENVATPSGFSLGPFGHNRQVWRRQGGSNSQDPFGFARFRNECHRLLLACVSKSSSNGQMGISDSYRLWHPRHKPACCSPQDASIRVPLEYVADGGRFERPERLGSPPFQSGAIGLSANHPNLCSTRAGRHSRYFPFSSTGYVPCTRLRDMVCDEVPASRLTGVRVGLWRKGGDSNSR